MAPGNAATANSGPAASWPAPPAGSDLFQATASGTLPAVAKSAAAVVSPRAAGKSPSLMSTIQRAAATVPPAEGGTESASRRRGSRTASAIEFVRMTIVGGGEDGGVGEPAADAVAAGTPAAVAGVAAVDAAPAAGSADQPPSVVNPAAGGGKAAPPPQCAAGDAASPLPKKEPRGPPSPPGSPINVSGTTHTP